MSLSPSTQLVEKARLWLSQEAIPLWTKPGFDAESGSFVEGISFRGQPEPLPRRTLVQARQIYSFFTAKALAVSLPPDLLPRASDWLLRRHSLPSGAFLHSVDAAGLPVEMKSELYTQAFALFGLAYAFAESREKRFRERALELLRYLDRERRAGHGGFTELGKDGAVFASNPHMHLFESALAWLRFDDAKEWRALADELQELALTRFIDPATGLVAEHFDERWGIRRDAGRFVFEPGHQFEWSWLLAVHEELTGVDSGAARRRLFELAEKHGICPRRKVAFDECWSDFSVKKPSSRYWPQCERAKAALRLGKAPSADEALGSLFLYLKTPVRGLAFDQMEEDGTFAPEPPKASCLYHIVNAIDEYIRIRPRLG